MTEGLDGAEGTAKAWGKERVVVAAARVVAAAIVIGMTLAEAGMILAVEIGAEVGTMRRAGGMIEMMIVREKGIGTRAESGTGEIGIVRGGGGGVTNEDRERRMCAVGDEWR